MSKTRRRVGQRDANDISSRRLLDPLSVDTDFHYDRRQFHPERIDLGEIDTRHPLRSISRTVRQKSFSRRVSGYDVYNPGHWIVHPRENMVCLRRRERREVIFATGGGGKRGRKKPRYNEQSTIKCRR